MLSGDRNGIINEKSRRVRLANTFPAFPMHASNWDREKESFERVQNETHMNGIG